MSLYTAYGLTTASDLGLPELRKAAATISAPDVTIRFAHVAPNGLPQGTQLGPFLWVTQASLWLDVPNVARFLVQNGREILIDPASGIEEDSIRVFLLGSAFGALLFQRGYLVMHGNAIRIGNQCMICVGQSGAGKSTLAAGFMQRGYDVLADDVVPVDEHCHAIPGFPRIKLWRDVADQLHIDTRNLSRIRPGMEKFNLPVQDQMTTQPIPVRWIYILDTDHMDEVEFQEIRGMQRLQPLYNNTYRIRFLEGLPLKSQHLKLCGQVAGKVHLARVTRPHLGFTLDSMIDRLLADMDKHA